MAHDDLFGELDEGEHDSPSLPDIQVTGYWTCKNTRCGTLVSLEYDHCGWCKRPRPRELGESK